MKLNSLYKLKSVKKLVWDVDEHQGSHEDRWYSSKVKPCGYNWSKSSFNGKAENYNNHIIR